jgi:hypothetical protein
VSLLGRRLLAVAFVAVAAAILSGLTAAALLYQARIPASGVMKAVGLEVYEDATCTVRLENIDWGLVAPGDSKSVTCYIKSGSNVEAELFLTSESWEPAEAAGFIIVSWDHEGAVLAAGTVAAAELTLHVDATISGVEAFNGIIVITAVEA